MSSSTPNAAYNADGGAGGDGGSFNLSQGGLIAIIVVVVAVVIFGVVSAVLFFLAKKRQWEIRKSIRNISRRFTGGSRAASRRGTVRMQSPPRGKAGADRDIEKGLGQGKKEPKATQTETRSQERVKNIVPESWSVGPQGAATKEGSR